MKIAGLQKLTLLDYPGNTACTIFTKGCNFRCPFCHNSLLVDGHNQEFIDEGFVLDFLSSRKGKLDGVCISGGEPLLQPDVFDFAKRVKELGFLVKLDTNGSNFSALEKMVKGGLCDYVAMDVKSGFDGYEKLAGCKVDLQAVENSIKLLLGGGVDYEFRTTVVNPLHSEDDFLQIAKMIKGAKKYYLQQFKDSGMILGKGCSAYSPQKMQEFLKIVKENGVDSAEIRGIDL